MQKQEELDAQKHHYENKIREMESRINSMETDNQDAAKDRGGWQAEPCHPIGCGGVRGPPQNGTDGAEPSDRRGGISESPEVQGQPAFQQDQSHRDRDRGG